MFNNVSAWDTGEASNKINAMSKSFKFDLHFTDHAEDQMLDRGITTPDVLKVLQNGFVFDDPVPATRKGCYKYAIEGKTPNSGSRKVRLIVIPDEKSCGIKIVTAMWRDER